MNPPDPRRAPQFRPSLWSIAAALALLGAIALLAAMIANERHVPAGAQPRGEIRGE